jgi:hypothetical protein
VQAQVTTVEGETHRVGPDPTQLTPLGRRLLELRLEGIAEGELLLTTWEELKAMFRNRRCAKMSQMGRSAQSVTRRYPGT